MKVKSPIVSQHTILIFLYGESLSSGIFNRTDERVYK
jgi:hypothetical protein